MKKNNYGLSLIELLITITISMILMASIGIFMSSGLSNIFLQEKNVGNILKINQISAKINQVLDLIEQNPIILEKDKIVFKVKNNFDFGGYATIATQEKDDFCENSAIRTTHLYLKNFVPILDEEQKLTYTLSDGIYTTNQKENKVYKGNKVFIGKSVYGDEILENDAFLNRPTGIAVKDNEVFVSDSLNDRVLKIIEENGQKKVIKILGKEDGILKPTYLKINENGNLEITSSGNNKKYELVFGNFPTNISYSEEIKEKDGKIKVNFLKDGENYLDFIKVNNNNICASLPQNCENETNSNGYNGNGNCKQKICGNFIYRYIKYNATTYGDCQKKYIGIQNNNNYEISNDGTLTKCEGLEYNGGFNYEYYPCKEKYLKEKDLNISDIYENCNSIIQDDYIDCSPEYCIYKKENYCYYQKKYNNNDTIKINMNDNNFEIFRTCDFNDINQDGSCLISYFNGVLNPENFKINKIEITDLNGLLSNIEITEKGNYSTSVKLENENEKQTYYERFLFSVYGNNLKLIGDYNEDLTNILKNTTFDENYDEILNMPIESLEISLDGDYLNFVLKYYKNFNCEDLESNKEKIQTLFLKKKVK